MNTNTKIIIALAGFGILGSQANFGWAADREAPSPTERASVTQTIQSAFPGAVLGNMGKENEDGIDVISVDFTAQGRKMEADVTPEGVLVDTEEPAVLKSLPKAAARKLRKLTKGMKARYEIARTYAKGQKDASGAVQVIKLDPPVVTYEADVRQNGKSGEFAVDEKGNVLEQPKWQRSGKGEGKEDKEDKD